MVANKQLRHTLRPPPTHGHIPGIAIGEQFANKGELAILGLHANINRGIDSR